MQYLKILRITSVLILIGGTATACYGAERVPQSVNYDKNNPMPDDASTVRAQLIEYQAQSYGRYLVILGCYIVGASFGFLLCSTGFLYYWEKPPALVHMKPRVRFSKKLVSSVRVIALDHLEDNVINESKDNFTPQENTVKEPVVVNTSEAREKLRKKLRQWIGSGTSLMDNGFLPPLKVSRTMGNSIS